MMVGTKKGEICGRNGCKGIIEAYEKEGSCMCHINPPCSYCTTQTEYCPVCGWSAEEETLEYQRNVSDGKREYIPKTDQQLFDELQDGVFGYIYVTSGAPSVSRLRGKHPGMTGKEILDRIGLSENPDMPRFKRYNEREFELTYFND